MIVINPPTRQLRLPWKDVIKCAVQTMAEYIRGGHVSLRVSLAHTVARIAFRPQLPKVVDDGQKSRTWGPVQWLPSCAVPSSVLLWPRDHRVSGHGRQAHLWLFMARPLFRHDAQPTPDKPACSAPTTSFPFVLL